MNRALACAAFAFAVSCAIASSARAADDLEKAIDAVKPPARFQTHTPNFAVKQQEFTFTEVDDDAWKASAYKADPAPLHQVKHTFAVITDGPRFVALYDKGMGQLDFINFDPTKTPDTLKMPSRYHWGSMLGTRIQTIPWAYGWAPTGDQRDVTWSAGGKTLTLVEAQTWTNKKDGSTRAKSSHTVTLRVDPALGYVVDIDAQYATREPNKRNAELSNIVPKGLSDPFNPQYDRLLYSDVATPGTFTGWNNNCYIGEFTNKNHPIRIRDGGIVAWLRGQRETDQWGLAVTRNDLLPARQLAFSNPTCNVWLDQHNCVQLGDFKDSAGLFTSHTLLRVVPVPPEVSAKLAKDANWLTWEGKKQVQIRMDGEDFEDQPLPVSTATRGACIFQGDLAISADQSHSGKRSLMVPALNKGELARYDFFLFAPQINLESNTRYRLEAWVKVVGDDTRAFVVGDFYDNDHHSDQRYEKHRTPEVKAADGWKHVAIEFDSGPTAPQIDLKFAALGTGTAYFDEFKLVKVVPTQANAR